MSLELLCAVIIAIGFGTVVAFAGYRLFLILLPVWGFVFGFLLGAQTMQALFGQGMFATATSWVVGFVVALIFAVLSYLFFYIAVAIIAGSLGYGLGVAIMGLFSADLNLLTWLVGVALAVVAIIITFRFSLQKWVIILATAIGGSAIAVGVLALGPTGIQASQALGNTARAVLNAGFIWALLFIVMAAAGFYVQWQTSRNWVLPAYDNRLADTGM